MNRFFKSFFAIIGAVVVSVFVIIMLFAFLAINKMGKGEMSSVISDSNSETNIGVVELEGEIANSKDFREKLFKFVKQDKIKAIVVRIDSPGGAVGASEEIYRYILEARKIKPIVCSLGNMAASGGLYSAMGCQKIITTAGTMSGSIGVIMMLPNVSAVMEKVGVSFNVIKTGQFKDAGTPFRELKEEDKEYLSGVAQTAFRQFIGAISQSRNLTEESVKAIADGRIILGEDAVKLGLADGIGGLYDAARLALELALGEKAQGKEPHLVFPAKEINFPELIRSVQQQSELFFNRFGASNSHLKFQMM